MTEFWRYNSHQARKIMIVAGEASGDLHGAHLIQALRATGQSFTVYGMGGRALAEAGVDLIFDAAKLSVVGLMEVLSHLKDIRKARKILIQKMIEDRPQVLVLIDFPDFNLSLASQAKKLGIPVFYYISPQVWAWRSGRVKKIQKLVDEMVVILPFEKEFYQQKGMKVNFVGHPLVDELSNHFSLKLSRQKLRDRFHVKDGCIVVGILPGSRKKEVGSLLPVFLASANRLNSKHTGNVKFLLPLAPTLNLEDLAIDPQDYERLPLEIIRQDRYQAMALCDCVMAASGTVTLELALLGVPMVVAYKIAPLTFAIGRRLITVPFVSLVNLVSGKQVVGEYLQNECTEENMAQAIEEIWPGTIGHREQKRELACVAQILGEEGASFRTAQLLIDLLERSSPRLTA